MTEEAKNATTTTAEAGVTQEPASTVQPKHEQKTETIREKMFGSKLAKKEATDDKAEKNDGQLYRPVT